MGTTLAFASGALLMAFVCSDGSPTEKQVAYLIAGVVAMVAAAALTVSGH